MGARISAGADNDELVDNLMEADYIKTTTVERVFRAVDRGHYFTAECRDNAYKDLAWKYGNLHMSAPCIYSQVMENLKLAPGMSFLNLGSGTGYLSTMAGLILGSYGINHGVEIYEDVINYAKEKLDEFCSTSPALDEYEFCQPKFINGNCLHLGSEARQYDRVYCGAACPENHENYMKNLIKVGGILVMPINDQLLQINRVSDTSWESKSVLPVSFASLICSNVPSNSEPLKMPDTDPLSLQDICRFAVRSILRRKIDMEHPELKKMPARAPRKVSKVRTLPNCVIPIFGRRSDSEDNDGDADGQVGVRDFGRRGFLMDVHSLGSDMTLLEWDNLLPGPSTRTGADDDDDEEEEEDEGDDVSEEEDDDSGHDREDNEDSVEKEVQDECMSDPVARGGSGDGSKATERQRQVIDKSKGKREKFDSGIVDDMEKGGSGSDQSDNELECRKGRKVAPHPHGLFLKFDDSDTETAASETSSGRMEEAKVEGTGEQVPEQPPARTYSTYMREKIKMLPLPMTLKYFVNLDREL